jgi:hypothetical protein
MTTDTATTQGPTLEEQIEYLRGEPLARSKGSFYSAILASLHELQRYRDAAAKVAEDVRPVAHRSWMLGEWRYYSGPGLTGDTERIYGPELHARCVALQARLKRLEDGLREGDKP